MRPPHAEAHDNSLHIEVEVPQEMHNLSLSMRFEYEVVAEQNALVY